MNLPRQDTNCWRTPRCARAVRFWQGLLRLTSLATLTFCLATVRVFAQSSWDVEVVDNTSSRNVGNFTSMAIDKEGNFHIGYHDESRGAVRYAFRSKNEREWHTMQLDAGGSALSLAIDSTGHPHFAYAGEFERGLRYAYWDGTKWNKQTIDPEKIAFWNSIQLSHEGLPRISYYQRLWQDGTYALHLKYASFDGKTWFIETVDPESATGKFNSLALDSAGNPHISYSDVDRGDLRYVYWDGSQWHYSAPDSHRASDGWVGLANSIVMDSNSFAHIAYLDVDHRKVKYTHWTGKKWETEFVDQLIGRADNIDRISLKLDRAERPHMVYYDSGLGMLKYAVRRDDGWHVERIDASPQTGLHPSLCLDNEDRPFVSYYDMANGALRFAARKTAAVAPRSASKTTVK